MTNPVSTDEIKFAGSLLPKYEVTEVLNVLLVLCGARPAFWTDLNDDKARKFVNLVIKGLPHALEPVDMLACPVPLIAKKGKIGKGVKKVLSTTSSFMVKDNIEAMRIVLGYTGTAFPCGKYKDPLQVQWYVTDTDDKHYLVAGQCAKMTELRRCFDDFKRMRESAKVLIGVKLGKIELKDMIMVVRPFDRKPKK